VPWLFAYGHFLPFLHDLSSPSPPERARLAGRRAAFGARSESDWGTRSNPAPLLCLVAGGSCRGMAVELSPEKFDETVSRWMSDAEGADLREEGSAEVGLPFRREVTSVTYLTADPRGPHALKPLPTERLARMVLVARGRRGTGRDYLVDLSRVLREWGMDEATVTALLKEVQKERGEGWR
jgi:cation transport regulator ChaC